MSTPGFFPVLLSMTGGTRYRHIQMMGMHHPSDERFNEFPAGSNIIHIIPEGLPPRLPANSSTAPGRARSRMRESTRAS